MTITTLDGFIAAAKQHVSYLKTASRTGVAGIPFSVFDLAGNPGAGTLAVGNTANGIIPTDAMAGYPIINAFGGGATGYLCGIAFGSTVAGRLILMDCLFSAGAYTFNDNVTLASQPSYAGRVPGGTDFNNTELWIECVTAFTGNQTIAVTYLDQDGNAGSLTHASGVAPIVGRMLQLPLQAGDTGLQQINSVIGSVATVGTFNIHVMRRLWMGRCRLNNDGDCHDFLKTGMPQIFPDSALRLIIQPDSTATGIPEFFTEIVNG